MKLPPALTLLALAVAAVAAFTVGCGGGTSSSDKTSTARAGSSSGAGTPASGGAPATSAAGATINVTARDFEFDPNTASAQKGKSITVNFSNQGATSHTFTLYTDEDHTKPVPNGDTGSVTAGSNKTLTIAASDVTGDLYFRCEIHPTQMSGEISAD